MNTLQNPCLTCDHHLADGDKNDGRCKDCEKRIAYINAIGMCPCSSVSEHVELEGGMKKTDYGPGKYLAKELDDPEKNWVDIEIKDLPGPKTKEEMDPIEEYIAGVCQAAGISVATLRKGIKGQSNIEDNIPFHNVRDEIIHTLFEGKFGPMSQVQIGKLLNIKNSTVSSRMRKMGFGPGRPGQSKYLTKTSKPQTTEMLIKSDIEPAPKIMSKMTVTIDFSKHTEVYENLRDLAEENLRSLENQALWIFLTLYQRGVNIEKSV